MEFGLALSAELVLIQHNSGAYDLTSRTYTVFYRL